VFDDCQKSLADGPSLGLYVHFPYCRQRCSYCDFNAHLVPAHSVQAYSDYHRALLLDIASLPPAQVSTVFWGGGTPSLMPLPYLLEAQQALSQRLQWSPQLENTLEVNPGSMDGPAFESLLRHGWNRLSLGAQAFQPELLELVGRVHTPGDIVNTYQQARVAGFDNLSLDLIYGFPRQTLEQWRESLESALRLEPQHLSIYCLTIEPSTRLEKQLQQGELQLPEEEVREAMDELTEQLLRAEGFRRYEVSNWARPGRESRHNLLYWTDGPYLGVGCGAVSYLDGWRSERIKPPLYYQKALLEGRSPITFAERRSQDGALKDTLMMGLRVAEGVCLEELLGKFPGLSPREIEGFFTGLPEHWWCQEGGRYRLTRTGWDFHSDVTMELLGVLFSFSQPLTESPRLDLRRGSVSPYPSPMVPDRRPVGEPG
jgi:oxygen-independent coproporphyrinogen-3 oxidase